MKTEHHFHLAAQAADQALEAALSAQGFVDDQLKHKGVIFGPRTAERLSSCALNVIHQSLPHDISTLERIAEVRAALEPILNDPARVPGYYHIENVRNREVATGMTRRITPKTFPVKPLAAQRRLQPKLWDMHLSINHELVPAIDPIFVENEFYSIDRTNGVDSWRVYTVQGINSVLEGEKLFDTLTKWLRDSGIRNYWAGFEVTTDMRTFGDTHGLPEIVPPTIDAIEYVG